MVKGLETMLSEELLRELSLFSLQKRRLGNDRLAIFKQLRSFHVEDEASLFSVLPVNKLIKFQKRGL